MQNGFLKTKSRTRAQLDKEQQGLKAVRNYGEAFRSRNVILLCAQYFTRVLACTALFCGCRRLSAAAVKTLAWWKWAGCHQCLTAATIAMIIVSRASDKLQNRKLFVWPPADRCFCLHWFWAVGANHFWASYTLLVIAGAAMYAPYGPFFAIIPEMLPRNVAGARWR